MRNIIHRIYQKLSNTDLAFLIFIVGIINVKLYVKIFFLLFYAGYAVYKKYKFSEKTNKVLLFYFIMPVLGIITPLLKYNFIESSYWFGYFSSLVLWIMAGVTFYMILTTVNNVSRQRILNAVDLFFALNIIVSVSQLIIVMFLAHSIIPYWVWDSAERFGASTGDNIYGISMSNSITNSAISVLGIVYFLFKNKRNFAIACAVILLLSTSNLSIFVSLFILVLLFIFSKKGVLRKNILFVVLCYLLYPLLSPTNMKYIGFIYDKVVVNDSAHKGRTVYAMQTFKNGNSIYTFKIASAFGANQILLLKKLKFTSDTSRTKNPNLKLDPYFVKNFFYLIYGTKPSLTPLAKYSKTGKIYTFHQTASFLGHDFKNLLFGAGAARFSSKTAIKMTGLGLQGNYPNRYIYVSPEFFQYHLCTILYFLSQDASLHSIINFPDSVYNQIAGEYGLFGIIAFLFLYLGYFWKNRKKYHYGLYLLLVALLFLGVQYWFEMISFTVIFELLMLLDIFASQDNNASTTISNCSDAGI